MPNQLESKKTETEKKQEQEQEDNTYGNLYLGVEARGLSEGENICNTSASQSSILLMVRFSSWTRFNAASLCRLVPMLPLL